MPDNQGMAPLREKFSRGRPMLAGAIERERQVEDFCKRIRTQLREQRENRGLDQKAIAQKLEIGQSAVSRLENGAGDVGLKTLFRYAAALGLKPMLLFLPSEPVIAQHVASLIEGKELMEPHESHGVALRPDQAERLIQTVTDLLPVLAIKLTE